MRNPTYKAADNVINFDACSKNRTGPEQVDEICEKFHQDLNRVMNPREFLIDSMNAAAFTTLIVIISISFSLAFHHLAKFFHGFLI